MRVSWNEMDRTVWDRAHEAASASLQQDWAYGAAMETLGAQVQRAAIHIDDQMVGLSQFTRRRLGFVLNASLCSRGPVWTAPLDAEAKALAYRTLKRSLPASRPRLTLFSPDEHSWCDHSGRGASLGVTALARVMTGYSTVVLDLQADLGTLRGKLDGKWRNRLSAAEAGDLRVTRNGVKPRQYSWLLDKERAQQSIRGYRALPPNFVDAFAAAKGGNDALMILRADRGRDPVAAMMFLIHGAAATYHIGWSNASGRAANAHNLLLWNAVRDLKERGVRVLDLGGVNTQAGAGVARFKIGSGGAVVTYAGTYV